MVEMKLESGEATIQTLVQTQTRPSSILNPHHHSPLSLYYRYSNSNQQCIVQCCLTNQINQKLSFSNNFSDWVIFCQFCTLHWFLLMQICFLLQGTMNEKYETVHDKYITHIKDKYCQLKSSWDPVVRKLWKREEVEEQDDDNHCHSPRRPCQGPWVRSLPAWRRKWLPLCLFFVLFIEICYKLGLVVDHHEPLLVRCERAEGGHLQAHRHPPWASEDRVWGKVTHKTVVIFSNTAKVSSMTTYLARQGSVLYAYKDGVKLSEVGIKDGCSVHLEEEGDEPAPPEPFEWKEEI